MKNLALNDTVFRKKGKSSNVCVSVRACVFASTFAWGLHSDGGRTSQYLYLYREAQNMVSDSCGIPIRNCGWMMRWAGHRRNGKFIKIIGGNPEGNRAVGGTSVGQDGR
jgi:hypothetical protein